MKAVILAGGFGTRLRPLSLRIPKPMVPLANRPLMERVVELLRAHSFTDLVSLLYFQPELLTQHFRDGADFGVSMSYVTTVGDLGTAGSVREAAGQLDSTFLVISADLLTDIDLTSAVEFHRSKGALATIVLTRVPDPLPYGVVFTDGEGRVTRFLEKPSWGEVFSDTVNTGIYILEPAVFTHLAEGAEADFSKNLFPKLLEEGLPLFGFVAEGYWKDLGTLAEYRKAHADVLASRVRVAVDGERDGERAVWIGQGTRVDPKAEIGDRVILGRNCSVGPGARIADSVLGDNCSIEAGASIVDAVLWSNVSVGRNAALKSCAVASGARIRDAAQVDAGAVVSELCTVGKGARIRRDVKIWPNREVEDGAILSTSLVWGEKWSRSLFGAGGVTGVANTEITPEFAAKLGAAFGATLPKGASILTARDTHKTPRMVNRALMTGILSTGVNVLDIGVTPVPVQRFAVRALKAAAGTFVRRSPYDPELVDMKFTDAGGNDLPPSRERAVETLFFREDFRRAPLAETGEISFPTRHLEHYREAFASLVDRDAIRSARFKIVVNYGFGPAAQVFPGLLEGLGCDVVALDAYLDQSRAFKTPEQFERAWDDLATIVRTLRASAGFMFDTGAEKVFLVDDRGRRLSGQQALAATVYLHLRAGPKGRAVAVPVTGTRAIEALAEGLHGRILRTAASTRALTAPSVLREVSLAAEPLGGFLFPTFHPGFDSMAATAHLLECLAKNEMRLSEALAAVTLPALHEGKVFCPWEKKGTVMRRLLEHAGKARVETIDGVRLFESESSVLVRPDPDHALFHVQAEAPSRRAAAELGRRLARLVTSFVRKAK